MDAKDKIDFWSALATSALITSSLVFALASLYALTYFNLIEFGVLSDIPFSFVIFSMIAAFNLTFTITVLDQLYS